jgi:hypothetical protein
MQNISRLELVASLRRFLFILRTRVCLSSTIFVLTTIWCKYAGRAVAFLEVHPSTEVSQGTYFEYRKSSV